MSTFESEITKVTCNDEDVYRVLSDMRNIELVKNRIPEDKVSDLSFDEDTCSFNVSPFGKIGVKIVDREPNKTIKFGSDQSPVGFDFWIQIKQVAENDTRIKLTAKADINMFLKPMIEPLIKPMLDKVANGLTKIDYKNLKK